MSDTSMEKADFLNKIHDIITRWESVIPQEMEGSSIYVGAVGDLEGITFGDELQQMHMILLDMKDALPKYLDNFQRLDRPENEVRPEDFSTYLSPDAYIEKLSASLENIADNIGAIRLNPRKETAEAKTKEIVNYLPGFKEMKATLNSRIVEMESFIDLAYESPEGDPMDSNPIYKLRKTFGAPAAWAAVNPDKARRLGKGVIIGLATLAMAALSYAGISAISRSVSEQREIKATQQAQIFSATATAEAELASARATQTSLESTRKNDIAQYINTLTSAENSALSARQNEGFWFTDSEYSNIINSPESLISQYVTQGVGDIANIEAAVNSASQALFAMSDDPQYQIQKSWQFFFVSAYSTSSAQTESHPSDTWLEGVVCGGFGDSMGTYGQGNYADDKGIVIIQKGYQEGLRAVAEVLRERRDNQTDSTIGLRADGTFVLGLAPYTNSAQITNWYGLGDRDITNISGDELVGIIDANQCPDGGQ